MCLRGFRRLLAACVVISLPLFGACAVSDDIVFGHVTASRRDYEPAAAMSVYFDDTQNVFTFELRRKPSK